MLVHPRDPALTETARRAGCSVLDAPDPSCWWLVLGGPDEVSEAASAPGAGVLAVTEGGDRSTVSRLLAAGATGVIVAGSTPEALSAALGAAAQGLLVVSAALDAALHRPSFTPRQRQVLGLLVLGLSNAEIAARLYLSEVTVKTHLTGIFSKLGVRSRGEAVAAVLDPMTGLSPGILAIEPSARVQDGYGPPLVR